MIGITELYINGKLVERKKNEITTWVEKATIEGNFANALLSDKLYPLKQWFSGCLLFDRNMSDIETNVDISLPDSIANIVAQGGDDVYSGTNTKRGSLNASMTGAVEQTIEGVVHKGYRFVWDWIGRGGAMTVGAVALTRANNGKMVMANNAQDTTLQTDTVCIYEDLSNALTASTTDVDIQSATNSINCIDYDKELGYSVNITFDGSKNVVSIKSYPMNTKNVHLEGGVGLVRSATPKDDISIDTNWTQQYVITNRISFTYTGDYFFIVWNDRDIRQLHILKISTEDWTTESYDFSVGSYYISDMSNGIAKDGFPMKYEESNGSITKWEMFAKTSDKFLKIDILALINGAQISAAVDEYTNPIANTGNESANNFPTLTLPNGDIIWWRKGGNYTNYYSVAKDEFKAVYIKTNANLEGANSINGMGKTGTAVLKWGATYELVQFYPHISTINNLASAHEKGAGDNMQLRYTLLEV